MIDFADVRPVPSDGSHLTADQVAAINSYMAELLKALDLAQWQVYVGRDLPPEGALLSIDPVDGRRYATLNVAGHWWETESPTEKRVDLVHEALHLAHHDTDEHIRAFFDGNGDLGEYTKYLILRQFKTNLERMVDSLSYVIAPFMPEWRLGVGSIEDQT